jgi:hypothetical protein
MANQGPYYAPGAYIGEVIAQGLTKNENTNNTQFVLRVKILGKPDASDPESMEPVTYQYERTMWMSITEKTAERVVTDLRKIGYQANSFGPLDPSHAQHESFIGNQVDLYCKHEADQHGQLREKWMISRQGGGMKIAPLEAKDVRALDMLFGKALKNAAPTPPSQRESAMAIATAADDRDRTWDGTTITDDDIPF